MVQLSKLQKDANQMRMHVLSQIPEVKVFKVLSFFKHVRGTSRNQPNIKMEPFVKLVNSSRDIQNGVEHLRWSFLCK